MTAMDTVRTGPLSPELAGRMNAYWRAANYLSVGQIYLYDNPLLKRPLELSDVKPLAEAAHAQAKKSEGSDNPLADLTRRPDS